MTLDGPTTVSEVKTSAAKMSSLSITQPSRNSLSFSISRLLEKAEEDQKEEASAKPEEKDEVMSEQDEDEEGSVEVDDSDDEDVKVHDSDDEEAGRSSMDYPGGPQHQQHHPAASGIDWYALYALQQQQQHPPGSIFPAHLLPPGYPSSVRTSGGGPSSSAYLSYSTASGVAPPAGFPSAGSASQHPDYHHGGQGGIPNAFAALLEATVFKDRLAAGNHRRRRHKELHNKNGKLK